MNTDNRGESSKRKIQSGKVHRRNARMTLPKVKFCVLKGLAYVLNVLIESVRLKMEFTTSINYMIITYLGYSDEIAACLFSLSIISSSICVV